MNEMYKKLYNKKGNADLITIIAICSMFILMGAFIPYIRQSFNDGYSSSYDTDRFADKLNTDVEGANAVTLVTVFWSILGLFFWTFGNLPFYVDIILLIPRVALMVAVFRTIRGN